MGRCEDVDRWWKDGVGEMKSKGRQRSLLELFVRQQRRRNAFRKPVRSTEDEGDLDLLVRFRSVDSGHDVRVEDDSQDMMRVEFFFD